MSNFLYFQTQKSTWKDKDGFYCIHVTTVIEPLFLFSCLHIQFCGGDKIMYIYCGQFYNSTPDYLLPVSYIIYIYSLIDAGNLEAVGLHGAMKNTTTVLTPSRIGVQCQNALAAGIFKISSIVMMGSCSC